MKTAEPTGFLDHTDNHACPAGEEKLVNVVAFDTYSTYL